MENYIVYDYIKKFVLDNMNLTLSNTLLEIELYALNNKIPIIDKEVQNFLVFLLGIIRPKKVLEFGTAIGFSTLLIYETLNRNVEITTMERDTERIEIAHKNFKKFDADNKIKIIEGDCIEKSQTLHENYDFIFIDSSKSHYWELFNSSVKKLNNDGIIVFDNILYKGMIASQDLCTKRKKTIVNNMRKFIENIVNLDNFKFTILPIGDGIMVLRRENNNEKS